MVTKKKQIDIIKADGSKLNSKLAKVTGRLQAITPPKPRKKLTKADKEARKAPLVDKLGELSGDIDTFAKQLERRKLVLQWLKLNTDGDIFEEEIIEAPELP